MRKSTKKFTAIALAATLAVSNVAFLGSNTASAASKTSVGLVTQEKDDSGYTTKYKYNKKGLVTKSVAKKSYKTSDADVVETVTTTYKYNKKNKISKKIEKDATKTTSYEMDESTGMTIKSTLGTVTDTDTTVTTYSYNKKGLATQSVATTTYTKAGSSVDNDKTRAVTATSSPYYYDDEDGYYNLEATELSDGRIIAGYNKRKPDGTYYKKAKEPQSAYFYDLTKAPADKSITTTNTTYAPNADGTYTVTSVQETNTAGVNSERETVTYGRVDGGDNYVAVKDGYFDVKVPIEKTKTVYLSDDEILKKLDVQTVGTGETAFEGLKKTDNMRESIASVLADVQPVTVDDVEYYDLSKDNLKSNVIYAFKANDAEASKEVTEKEEETKTYRYSYTKADGTTGYTDNVSDKFNVYTKVLVTADNLSSSKDKTTTTTIVNNKNVETTKYTYDKKKRVKTAVTTRVKTNGSTYTKATESTNTQKEQGIYITDGDILKTTVSNNQSKGEDSSSATYVTTTKYTYDKKGRVKTSVRTNDGVLNSTESEASMDTNSNSTTTRTPLVNGVATGTPKTTTSSTVWTGTYPEVVSTVTANNVTTTTTTHNPYQKSVTTTDEKGKTETDTTSYTVSADPFANRVIVNSTTAYQDNSTPSTSTITYDASDLTTTTPLLANPTKDTTKYAYDKKGNVKSAKTTGTYASTYNYKNEDYGNTIYEFDAAGVLRPKQNTVVHKYTNNKTKENTVSKKSKRLTKVLVMTTRKSDRTVNAGYELSSRTTYKVKNKKFAKKASKTVKKQQWALQNGNLNGTVGLK